VGQGGEVPGGRRNKRSGHGEVPSRRQSGGGEGGGGGGGGGGGEGQTNTQHASCMQFTCCTYTRCDSTAHDTRHTAHARGLRSALANIILHPGLQIVLVLATRNTYTVLVLALVFVCVCLRVISDI